MKAKNVWVVVADGSRARIFQKNSHGLEQTMSHDMCWDSLKNQEIASDKSGRAGIKGKPGGQSFAPRTDLHEYQKQMFAKELCNLLEEAGSDFDEVILISPPKILGSIRANMSKKIKDKTVHEIGKDVTKLKQHELEGYMDKIL